MSKPYPVNEYGRLDMRAWVSLHCQDIQIHCGLEFDRGWDLLIHELLTDIAKVLDEENKAKSGDDRASIFVYQVKEKFATLRFYWSGENLPEDAHDRINASISRADAKSAITCEISGGVGRLFNFDGTWRTRASEFESGNSPAYPFNRPAFLGRSSRSDEKVYRYNVMDAGWVNHHVVFQEQFSYEGHDRLADGIVRESEEFMRIAMAVLPIPNTGLWNEFEQRGRDFPADTLLAKFTDNRSFLKGDPLAHLLNSLKNDKMDLRDPYRMADAEIQIERLGGKVREVAVLKTGEHAGKVYRVREYGAEWADVVDYLDAAPLGRVADDILCSLDRAFIARVGGQLSAEVSKAVKIGKPGFDARTPLWKLAGRLRLVIQQLGKKEALEAVPLYSGAFQSGFFKVAHMTVPRISPLFDTYCRGTKKLRRRMCLHQYADMRLPFDRHAVVPMRNRGVVAAAVRKANHAGVKLPKPAHWKPSAYMQMHTHRASFVVSTYANARSQIIDEAMSQVVACATAFVEAAEAAARKREIERHFSVPVIPDPVELTKYEESKAAFFASYGITTGEEFAALKDKASKLFSEGYALERAFKKFKTAEGDALAEEVNKLAMEAGGFGWFPIPNAAVRLREIETELERLQRDNPV